MRNSICLALLALGCLSCNSTGYKVLGSIDAADGTMVYMMEYKQRDASVIDSASVTNKQFVFTGTQEMPIFRVMKSGDKHTVFVLENAVLNLSMDEGATTGSPLNEKFNAYNQSSEELSAKIKDIVKQVEGIANEEEQKAFSEAMYDSVMNMQLNFHRATLKENADNLIGWNVFEGIYYMLDPSEAYEFAKQIPESGKTERIQKIEKMLEASVTTQPGSKFMDFGMQSPTGEGLSLGTFVAANKYTLVDFWASWCGPCRASMPGLVELYKQYKDKGFEIVGVSLDKDKESWVNGIEKLGITWPQMSDLAYWESVGAALYGVSSIPATVLINQEGIIVARNLEAEELAEKLDEFFKAEAQKEGN